MDTQCKFQTDGVTRVVFRYDDHSGEQIEMNAYVEEIDGSGGRLTMEKRVGPMNYTGFKHEGEMHLSREQVDELLDIISHYDIKAYSKLRTRGYGSSATRSLFINFGEEEHYYVPWDAIFPVTLPPEEDIMYMQVFNYFNGLIRNDPEWAEVQSDDLDDPRDNPAYYDRVVVQCGKEVHLVPGTGTYSEDGRGATIDYGDKLWWVEEGFTGKWTMSADDARYQYKTADSATLVVNEDGSCTFDAGDEHWTGELYSKRIYHEDIVMGLSNATGESRAFLITPMSLVNYGHIHIHCHPGPHPEPQFYPTDLRLTKVSR